MKRKDAKAYMDRYRLLNEFSNQELLYASYAQKFHQLESMMQLAHEIMSDSQRDREDTALRDAWNQLRNVLGS